MDGRNLDNVYRNISDDLVSILARPHGRAQRQRVAAEVLDHLAVSILARPHGRAQPTTSPERSNAWRSFNPRPPSWTGATPERRGLARAPNLFQSSPALMDGRNRVRHRHHHLQLRGFNPRPPSWTGATSVSPQPTPPRTWRFNPRPPSWTGATRFIKRLRTEIREFQSSPALMDGRNLSKHASTAAKPTVSILARPHGRAQRVTTVAQETCCQRYQLIPLSNHLTQPSF